MLVFFGGWFAKMGRRADRQHHARGYLRWFEERRSRAPRGLTDICDTLTYRERYEAPGRTCRP
ncbi:hypothetical protein ACFSQT_37645 [Mesorhizobium calcicola]|uniref:Uncharacterized protein n=1 Tax=Mesorhizobium calcicola TaxID=1300310 RepID=A0ABW4WR36_9HYPH